MDTQTTLGAGEIIRLPKSSKFNTFLTPESHRSEPNTKSFQDQKGNSRENSHLLLDCQPYCRFFRHDTLGPDF